MKSKTTYISISVVLIGLAVGSYFAFHQSPEECVAEGIEEIRERSDEFYGEDDDTDSGFQHLHDKSNPKQVTSVMRTLVETINPNNLSDNEDVAFYFALRALLDDCGIEYER